MGILLLGMSLFSCSKTDKDNLFDPQEQSHLVENKAGTQEIDPQEVYTQEKDTQQADTQEADQVITPGIFSEDLSDKVLADEQGNGTAKMSEIEGAPNIIIEDQPEGDTMATLGQNELSQFYYEEISNEIKDRIYGISYAKNCEIPYEDLRYVKVLHWGFDQQTHEGELIVSKLIAEDIVEIFKELYELKYPIERMVLVDEYNADDNTSMAANNSSAFNYRVIDGTNRISLHSYGVAIDINPQYNPYVRTLDGKTVVTPVNGAEYADRTLDCPYYITSEDPCYRAFIKRGFTWGGEWKNQKDYQHFQKTFD